MRSRKSVEFFKADKAIKDGKSTVEEACQKFGITTKTFYKLRKQLNLPDIKEPLQKTFSLSKEVNQLRSEIADLRKLTEKLAERLG